MLAELDGRIRELAETLGADLVGVADLSLAYDAILTQGGPAIAGYPRAISIGIALLHAILDQLPQRSERAVAVSYRHHCYDLVNQRLDLIASRLSSVLQHDGYRALPVPASKRVDDERICAVFSHKMAAYLAGLGWIGKSCLLVTPGIGPRLSCPPYSPTPEQTRSVIDCYRHAILVRGNRSSNIRELVAELEREIFLAGFYKALGFGCGPCELCTTCEIENGCRYPEKARPSMEAAGIDVFATVRNAGLPIKVLTSINQRQERYGLVLVN